MKKLFNAFMLLLVMSGATSCGNDLDPMVDGNHRNKGDNDKPMMKTIRMSFGGDVISESEEPMLRANDPVKYTAINVFRTEKDKEGAKEEKYAYGLFKNKDNVSIDVVTGYTYRFESSILIDMVDKFSVTNKLHAQPFQFTNENAEGPGSYYADNLNKFQYTYTEFEKDKERFYFHQLKKGDADVDGGADYAFGAGVVKYPRVKRYYGTYPSFDPGLTTDVNINMDYKCFGLKFEIVSLPSGYVTVEDVTVSSDDGSGLLAFPKGLELSDDNKAWDGVYSMNNLLGESKTFTLKFTWHKGGNATENFTTQVTVKPKTRKVLRLNINGNPNFETKGNITFTMGSEDLTDEVQDAIQSFN